VAVREPHDESVPAAARGMTFLTSVRNAKRLIRARSGRATSAWDHARAVIYFAVYDVPEPDLVT
jgi:hypothetical protein